MSDAEEIPAGLLRTKEGIYVLEHDTHLSRWIEQHGRLDIAEPQIALYRHLIPYGGVVIDAGASLGDHTLTYAKLVGPEGMVLAFEPNPLAYAALELNLKQFTNASCINRGLSDDYEYGAINIDQNAGASYISEFRLSRDSTHKVRLCPIDASGGMFGLSRCDLIHLDCEGCEFKAISGGLKAIGKFRPAMVIEINHGCLKRYGLDEGDMRQLIESIGYSWNEMEPQLGPHCEQRDIIALPK